jgi:hypothetical protein
MFVCSADSRFLRNFRILLSPLTTAAFLRAGAVSLFSLLLYLATLRAGVGWGDSAEFQFQAMMLGPTHPPGNPVYVLIAHALSFVCPEPAFATNLMSALVDAGSRASDTPRHG